MANPEFKLLFESYTRCHPANMNREDEARARQGWWNGVNVLVRDGDNLLEPLYLPTLRDRTLYENDRVVHSAKYGVLAPEAVAFLSALAVLNPLAAAKGLVQAVGGARRLRREHVGEYLSVNTFSEHLPESHFNSRCKGPPGRTRGAG